MHPFMKMLTISFLAFVWIFAHADDDADASQPPAPAADDAVPALIAFDDANTLSDGELNEQRARERIEISQITINDQDQDGDVTDNVAVGNTNGDNLIDGDAFSHSQGFLSTVQNTGNNVLIQNSTIINVTVDAAQTAE